MENSRTQQELKESEQYLENIINNIGDPVFVKDEQSKFLLVNDAFCALFNLSRADIIGKTLAEDVTSHEMEIFLHIDKQVLATGIENINEEPLTVRGEETRIIATKKTRFIDTNGNKFLIGTIRDITDRKKADAAIAESEEKYRILSEVSPDFIMRYDEKGRHTYMNKAALKIAGYTEEQIIGKTHREAGFDPQQSDYWEEKIDHVFKTGNTVQEQFEWQSVNGPMHLDWRLSPELDANGKVVSVQGVSRDITKLKLSEQKIVEKENQLRLFIEYSPAALVMLDTNMNYINVSNQWLKNYKFRRETVIGKNHYEVFPEMPEHWKRIHQLCMAGASEKMEEDLFVRADGTQDWIRWEIHPWYKKEDEIGGIIIFSELITEKKIANEALQKSLQRNTAFLNTIPDLIFIINNEGVFTDFHNPSGKETLYSPENFLGKKVKEVLPKEMAAETLINIEMVLKNGENIVHHYQLDYPEGMHYFEARYAALSKSEVMTIVRDITIEKQADIKIKESEEKFRTLVQQSGDGIFLVDKEGNYLDANETASYITGYSIDELKKMHASELVPPEELDQKPLMLEDINKGHKVFIERKLKRKNETFVDVEITAKLMDNGKVITTIRDITEKKKSQQQLAESEHRLRTILESEPECVKLLDRDGKVVDMNPAGLKMLEADNLEMIQGKPVLQFVNQNNREDFANLTKRVFKGESGKLEFELTGFKGTSRILETNAVPFRDQKGDIIYLLAVTRDVSDRIKAEQKIIQMNKELEQRVKERTAALESANLELQEVNDLFIGREARIIELKEELEATKTKSSLK